MWTLKSCKNYGKLEALTVLISHLLLYFSIFSTEDDDKTTCKYLLLSSRDHTELEVHLQINPPPLSTFVRIIKSQTGENSLSFTTQRNLCVETIHESKRSYYVKINTKAVSDNKRFWKGVRPLFSNNVQTSSSIILLESSIMKSDDNEGAEILNYYLVNITHT